MLAAVHAVSHYTELFNQDLKSVFQVSPLTPILNKFTLSSHRMTVPRIRKEFLIFRKTFKGVKVQPLLQGHELPGDCLGAGTSH